MRQIDGVFFVGGGRVVLLSYESTGRGIRTYEKHCFFVLMLPWNCPIQTRQGHSNAKNVIKNMYKVCTLVYVYYTVVDEFSIKCSGCYRFQGRVLSVCHHTSLKK